MSSCSSEVDVVKTPITTCDDDDNGILYAYQSKPGYGNQSVQSNTYYEEQRKSVADILNRCKIIQNSVQTLNKKFKTIHGKVSKIYRFRTKLIWQNRKPLGYAYKHYSYLLSRKVKLQKKKTEMEMEMSLPASCHCGESYSPTIPVKRPKHDSQSSIVGNYYASQDSIIHDNEDHEMRLSQSPTFPPYTQEDSSHYISDEQMERSPFIASFDNQGPHSAMNILSGAKNSTSVSAAMLEQDASDGAVTCPLSQSFPQDPSTWTVDEVVLFLEHTDPEAFIPIADTFKKHGIDGIALLLLQSEVMIKFMGIKLGTALKLCHYVEKLKAERSIKVY
ncbi:unnamed protein product [Pipistrellus nathusii]|uniref:SAM domain-containing protein n=1 Tax=Pipistrellus nathusii TaxID=59473 RepID=A0ABP0AJD4_PIPNA